eukprot:scaffold255186_cov29-Tisochrysis_lutea.AAC.4
MSRNAIHIGPRQKMVRNRMNLTTSPIWTLCSRIHTKVSSTTICCLLHGGTKTLLHGGAETKRRHEGKKLSPLLMSATRYWPCLALPLGSFRPSSRAGSICSIMPLWSIPPPTPLSSSFSYS